MALVLKNLPANVGDLGSIPRSGTSPGGGHDNQSTVLAGRIPMDREEPDRLQSMGS